MIMIGEGRQRGRGSAGARLGRRSWSGRNIDRCAGLIFST